MKTLEEFLDLIEVEENRLRTIKVINWVKAEFPKLELRIAWNQPMYTDHGTFIIGFSTAKKHLAVAPEGAAVIHFSDELEALGIDHGTMLLRFPWDKPFPYDLVKKIIAFNIEEKKECHTFWRK